ncbi:MAG: holo-ACP synthase [Parafilimonas sp.]
MIEGAGIDIIEVERIKQNIEKDAGFKELIFSVNEINYCESKANKFEHYAARFAAKEAFFKALGTGWKEGTNFNEIEIVNNLEGKPELILSGTTKQTLSALGFLKILVSLSHLKTLATAVVIIEEIK